MIRVTAFKWVPPFAAGLARDLRVRWALEEAGIPYEEKLIGQEEQSSPEYRALQPFGQVPVYEEEVDGQRIELFESGAIVLHIAERSEILLPSDPAARAKVIAWLFAALNSMEPFIGGLTQIDLFAADSEWGKLRRPEVLQRLEKRLDEFASALGEDEYLVGSFSAADLMMTTVLRILRHTDLVEKRANLAAYKQRCEARPAFQKALADQLAPFERNAPPVQQAAE